MPKRLKLSDSLFLPYDAITQRLTALGRTGSGKTTTACVLVEEVLKARQQVVILDPKGDWWGLRSSADGKHPGLPITIFGGDHGDVPLEPTAGTLIADLVVNEGISVVLDLSNFESKNDENRFATDFADRLYRKNRKPLLFVIDESDQFCPQKPERDEYKMLGRFSTICRRGRKRGIGVFLISQRSAEIAKSCLSQTEVMIAHQTTGSQDRDALERWVSGKGTDEQQETFMSSLASLKIGVAFVWSPSWLDVFKKVTIRPRETYDSSATPRVGVRRRPPKVLAPVDIERLKKHMATTIEKAKQDDPRLLREEIARLKAELAKIKMDAAKQARTLPQQEVKKIERVVEVPVVKTKTIEVPIIKPSEFRRLEAILKRCEKLKESLGWDAQRFEVTVGQLYSDVSQMIAQTKEQPKPIPKGVETAARIAIGITHGRAHVKQPAPVFKAPKAAIEEAREEIKDGLTLKAGARKMLAVVATYSPIAWKEVATLSGMSPTSGTFITYKSVLQKLGYVQTESGTASLTEDGAREVGSPIWKQTPEERIQMWNEQLKKGAREMFSKLVGVFPNDLSKEELAEAVAMSSTSGTFITYMSNLRKNGIVEHVNGKRLRAAEVLFK